MDEEGFVSAESDQRLWQVWEYERLFGERYPESGHLVFQEEPVTNKRQSLYGGFWFGRSLFFEARIDTNSKMKDLTPNTSAPSAALRLLFALCPFAFSLAPLALSLCPLLYALYPLLYALCALPSFPWHFRNLKVLLLIFRRFLSPIQEEAWS